VLKVKKKRIIIPYRSFIKWLVRLRRSPRAIAGGFALGTFVAFTPTMGIQFFIVMFLATILNMNRPAAFVTIWITNIATVAPIYTFNYWVGSLFWEGPSVKEVYRTFMDLTVKLARMDLWDIMDQFRVVRSLGQEVIIPLMIGSVIVGVIAAALVYLASFGLINYLSIRRNRKRFLH
jgi:uncharacterized protein (DUF2062 family)